MQTEASTPAVCRDVVDLALEYIRQELPEEQANRLEKHLSRCPSCINFIRTYEYVPNVSREVLRRSMPSSVKESLMKFLHAEVRR